MSAFGFSLPGTQSYYNQRRGQRGPRQSSVRAKALDKVAQVGPGAAWYEYPDLTFTSSGLPHLPTESGRPGGQAIPLGEYGIMPEWAVPQYGSDVGGFYEGFQEWPGFHRGLERDWRQEQRDQADWAARKTSAETGAAAAEEEFGAGKASALERYEGFVPKFAEMSANWERFAAPDYKAVSDYAINPALAEATRGGALYSQTARNQMAARGLGRSGLSASLQGAGAGMAARGRGMIRGGQATANEQMRRQAAQQLMTSRGLEAELGELIGRTELLQNPQALAWEALQADILNQRTSPDPYAFPSLMHGLTKEEQEFQFLRNQQNDLQRVLEQANAFDLPDFLLRLAETFAAPILGRMSA